MSIRVMARVWQHSSQRAGTLLVLLAIADYADDGGVAFPSVHTLMEKSRLSERSVQTALRRLESSGELAVEAQAGPHRCNLYRVRFTSDPADSAPRKNFTPQETTPEGAENDTQRVQPAAPKPSLNRQKNRQSVSRSGSTRACVRAREDGRTDGPTDASISF